MTRKSCFFAFCLFLSSLGESLAQSYSYRHYSTEDGVSSSTVYCVLQDSKGFMWFGTETGACRFDGKTFTRFTMDNGLADNEILEIHEDNKGRIWFLAFNGKLSFLENEIFHNPDNDPVLKKAIAPSNSLLSFYQDKRDCIWIGTFENGLIKIDGQKVSRYDLSEHPLDDKGAFVQEDSLGQVWGIKNAKCLLLDKGPAKTFRSISFQPHNKTHDYTQGGNLLFFNSDSCIYLVEQMKTKKMFKVDPPVFNLVHNLYMDRFANVWTCTRGSGCQMYSSMDGSYIKKESFLPGKTVTSVCVDNEANTWIATVGEGIYMLPADYKNYFSYTTADGLSEQKINSLAEDGLGNIWLGLSNGKLDVITKNGIEHHDVSNKLPRYNRIMALFADKEHSIWCATDAGLCIFKDNSRLSPDFLVSTETQVLKSIASNPVTHEISLTSGYGITRIKRSDLAPGYLAYRDTMIVVQRTFTHNYDHQGNLYVGNIEGLNFYYANGHIKYWKQDRLLQSRITDIKEFQNEVMVLATYGKGVLFFRNGKVIQQLTMQHELAGNICKQICIRDSVLWIATNLGLSKIVAENGRFLVKQNINSNNGLVSNSATAVLDDGEKLYVATEKGLSVVVKNSGILQTEPPLVYVTRLTTDDKTYSTAGVPEISFNNYRLLVDFIAVTYKNPGQVKYLYRLNKDRWTETKNNSVEFSSLSPGHYTFELKAQKIDSPWSPPVQCNFVISGPFWQNLWFQLFLLLLFLSSIYGILKYYATRKLRFQLQLAKQKQAIEAERNRIASDMHDDLGSDLTRISIWSNIAAGEKDNIELMKQHTQRISAASNSLLKKMDEIIWTLSPTNDTIENLISYLHQFVLNFFENTPIRCSVTIENDMPSRNVNSVFRRNIFLAVKESLNNVIKHSGANAVVVDMHITDSHFRISICDDGKGFEVSEVSGKRHGVANLSKRLQQIGGKIVILSAKEKGTQIFSSIPLPLEEA